MAAATLSAAISEETKLGLRLFLGDGQCVRCHSGPLFSDNLFHNIGVSQDFTLAGRKIGRISTGRQS